MKNEDLSALIAIVMLDFIVGAVACSVAIAALFTSKSIENEMKESTVVRIVAPCCEEPESESLEPIKEIDEPATVEETSEPVSLADLGYYDVPLDVDLQNHILILCEAYEVDPAIVIGMIQKESMFRADVVGDSGRSYGLMQIQPRWHAERMERLGVTDLLDPYQNIRVGVDFLSELIDHYKSVDYALIAYNGGPAQANKHRSAGTVSGYVRAVKDAANQLKMT